VDALRNIASEGSVSIIDLKTGKVTKELLTGLHASALAVSPDQEFVVCANAGSDNLSLIDVKSESIVETVWAKSSPADLFGASPNAIAFDPSGKRLYVANGTQNAVAVMDFDPEDKGETKLIGL
jgi:DNA-binding beta-propeller fold protein YncE